MFFNEILPMDTQVLVDQLKVAFAISVWTLDGVLKTLQE